MTARPQTRTLTPSPRSWQAPAAAAAVGGRAALLSVLAFALFAGAAAARASAPSAPAAPAATPALTPAQLLDGFRHVEVASVSDAEETLLGQRMYMRHGMRPLFPAKFAGFALTVELKRAPAGAKPTGAALGGMLSAIDHGVPGSVFVLRVDHGLNYAGMGGEMGTAMSVRGFAGAVIDGGVRDRGYLKQILFPVFGRSLVPSTTVGHYVFASANQTIVCDGVPVHPGDIIAADGDGVVVVPRADAARVLALARKLDENEHVLDVYIAKYKSMEVALKKVGGPI